MNHKDNLLTSARNEGDLIFDSCSSVVFKNPLLLLSPQKT